MESSSDGISNSTYYFLVFMESEGTKLFRKCNDFDRHVLTRDIK